MEPWVGICYDDGSGKNVYYVDDKRRVKLCDFIVSMTSRNEIKHKLMNDVIIDLY